MSEPDPLETVGAFIRGAIARAQGNGATGDVKFSHGPTVLDAADMLAVVERCEQAERRNRRAIEFLRDGPFGRLTALMPQSLDAAVIRILEGGEAYPAPTQAPAPPHVHYMAGVSDEEIRWAKRKVTEAVAELMNERLAERERLVHDDPELAAQIREGTAEAERGDTVDLGSFAQHLDSDGG